MKRLIKKLLRENLEKTELGNREDARWASKMPTFPPFVNLLVQVDTDYGRDSKLYKALLQYFTLEGKDFAWIYKILKSFNVEDEYKHFLHMNEEMIDGQNMNQGTETACNKMSVATYAEGIKLITAAIGTPQQNPNMWQRISKPLNDWKQANTQINGEIDTEHMSGDSMVDESNTWWATIQSTICEQGWDGLNEESTTKTITVYHGTNAKFVDKIKQQGLTSHLGYDKASWYMVSTDLPSALFHATASDDTNVPIYVFEFHLPITNEKWEGYPYFWPPYDRSDKSKWFSLKQPLPAKFIKKIHEIPYSKWEELKSTKNF